MAFQILCQSCEETAYRVDALGDAVKFVDWIKNAITIDSAYLATPQKFSAPDTFKKIDAAIQGAKALKNASVGLTGGA